VSGGVKLKAEIASIVGMKAESKNPNEDLSKSRKESVLNCLLTGNRGFIYTREIKNGSRKHLDKINGSRKITDLFDEGRTETAGKENAGLKTWQPVWNYLH